MFVKGKGFHKTSQKQSNGIVFQVDQGLINTQYNLGLMYAYGKVVSQANKEAAKWFQLAMEQDNKLAQGELAMLPSKKSLWGKIKDIFKIYKEMTILHIINLQK